MTDLYRSYGKFSKTTQEKIYAQFSSSFFFTPTKTEASSDLSHRWSPVLVALKTQHKPRAIEKVEKMDLNRKNMGCEALRGLCIHLYLDRGVYVPSNVNDYKTRLQHLQSRRRSMCCCAKFESDQDR